jgi:hypothetical protein
MDKNRTFILNMVDEGKNNLASKGPSLLKLVYFMMNLNPNHPPSRGNKNEADICTTYTEERFRVRTNFSGT